MVCVSAKSFDMEGKERLSFGCTVKNFERRNELALPSKW
jgi:hypothetical protein